METNTLKGTREITERLEELEEEARDNRDQFDTTPLIEWLGDEEQKEYKKLKELWNNIKI